MTVTTRVTRMHSLTGMGRFAEAAACEAETTPLAEKTGHAFTIGLAHTGAIALHLTKGDWATAHSHIERLLAVSRPADIKAHISPAVAFSALVHAQLDERSEAMSRLKEAEELLEQQIARGNPWAAPGSHFLGRACLVLGRIDDAWRVASRAIAGSAARPTDASRALLLMADVSSHPDRFDPEHAETCYRQAMASAETQGRRPVIAHCHLGLGRLYSRIRRRQDAEEHLAVATTMYREMDMRFWLEQADAELKELT
jgi:tetratricopeptide (TPR) repeat protein